MINENDSNDGFLDEEQSKKYSEDIMKDYITDSEIYVTALQLREIIKDAFLEGIHYVKSKK